MIMSSQIEYQFIKMVHFSLTSVVMFSQIDLALPWIVFLEMKALSTLNIVPVYVNVFISVGATLFVPESQGVHQLMHHNTNRETTWSQ